MALLLLCYVAIVTFLPATLQQQHSMDSWLMFDAAAQQSAPRRITPKSIFIAPSFSHAALPSCAEGYRPDAMGRCVKVVRVNQAAQLDFLLRRLNTLYAPPIAPTPTDSSGPLQVSLPIEEVKEDPAAAVQTSGSSVEVAVVLADVVKENETGADVPQTMLAVWNISKNTTSASSNGSLTAASENIDAVSKEAAGSSRRNTTGFLSSLSLPKVEETIPIVMQTPPSTLVIQDLPGSDTISRPLSSEVDLDFDIPYYDYYQDRDSTERRCPDPPCKDSFTEINSRSPHVPDTAFMTSSELQSDNTTEYNVTESSVYPWNFEIGENDTHINVSGTEATLKSNVTDTVEEHESEIFPNEQGFLPVSNDTESDILDSVINSTISLSSSNASYAVIPDIYVGSFETSVEVSVKPMTDRGHETEEIIGNNTDFVSSHNSSDTPVPKTLPETNVTDSGVVNSEPEMLPKKPIVLPEESSLVGTSMDPLSDANVAGSEESSLAGSSADTTEQRSPAPEDHRTSSAPPVRFPSGLADAFAFAKSGRVRFPDAAESRVVFPTHETSGFWWLPAGWRLDQSRHHPVLLRFWKQMPESKTLPRRPHLGQLYPTYAGG